jgi:3,4-dihydroxy 2-butanone 4-phosphate synthase/GTP cyclohydrolase II
LIFPEIEVNLRELGVEFESLINAVEAKERPFITIGFAQSIDGCLSERRGETTRLSGTDSITVTHMVRALHSAILVGKETLNADNPLLTVRHVVGPSPQRIILSSSLDFNPESKMFTDNTKRPWVATSIHAPEDKKKILRDIGCQVIECQPEGEGIDLTDLARQISERGIKSLMIEGGAKVIDNFLKSKLADLMIVTIAPVFMAGKSSPRLLPSRNIKMTSPRSQTVGTDMLMWGKPDFTHAGGVNV